MFVHLGCEVEPKSEARVHSTELAATLFSFWHWCIIALWHLGLIPSEAVAFISGLLPRAVACAHLGVVVTLLATLVTLLVTLVTLLATLVTLPTTTTTSRQYIFLME